MIPVKIIRHNTRLLKMLPKAAQAGDKRQFTRLDAQAKAWNVLNKGLRKLRGPKRKALLKRMAKALKVIDKGIVRRNREFNGALKRHGVVSARGNVLVKAA